MYMEINYTESRNIEIEIYHARVVQNQAWVFSRTLEKTSHVSVPEDLGTHDKQKTAPHG